MAGLMSAGSIPAETSNFLDVCHCSVQRISTHFMGKEIDYGQLE